MVNVGLNARIDEHEGERNLTEQISGGCACRAVRYSFSHAPRYMGNCHCRDCQRATGSAYFPGVLFLEKEFTLLSGEPKWFESKSDAGNTMRRGFCPDCGSPLFLTIAEREGVRLVYASSLDDPEIYQPIRDIFVSSAHAWDIMSSDLPKFERGAEE